MRAGTDLLLYRLLWVTELLYLSPYVRHGGGFYDWAARHGYSRQINRLESQALAEKTRHSMMGRLLKLTDQGREKVAAVTDPNHLWNRDWDGEWEIALFDIPEADRIIRHRLRKLLRAEKFGQLQQSVWLRPSGSTGKALRRIERTTTSGVLQIVSARMRARDQRDIVKRAWDWDEIGETIHEYRAHLKRLKTIQGPDSPQGPLNDWFLECFAKWRQWMRVDPLLPRKLWPTSYRGLSCWKEKQHAMRHYVLRCHPKEFRTNQ